MSILIKGMGMPKNCEECKLRNGIGKGCGKVIFYCTPLVKWVEQNPLGRADDCPIVPVPPHGDLIDISKLEVTWVDITDLPLNECLPVYLREDVDNAHTIIKAEEV